MLWGRSEVGERRTAFLKEWQYGHFLLRGISPGEYKVFCWDEVEDGAWEDPDFLKAFENQGQEVSLKEADFKTVDIVVIEAKSPR